MKRVRYCNGLLSQDNNHWWYHPASDSFNHLQNASTFRVQKAKYSSAKEPISTQYANKRATRILGTIKKTDLQSFVKDKCKHLSADRQRSYCRTHKWVTSWRHFRWLEKLSRSPFIKGREYLTITKLSQCKNTQNTLMKLRGGVNWRYWSDSKHPNERRYHIKYLLKTTPYAISNFREVANVS
jgi:hypothetical protein